MLVTDTQKITPSPILPGILNAGDPALQNFIPACIAMAAASNPTAVAVRDGNVSITYAGLADVSNRMAARLTHAGVATETLVGICLPRSVDRILAMLAVWIAGGAVLILDPAWPVERLRFLLGDAHAPLVLTTNALAAQLNGIGCAALDIDAFSQAGDGFREPGLAPLPRCLTSTDDTLAYVVYTSGSTGEPKGVEITQGNLKHLIAWHRSAFSLSSADRVSHSAGLGFDASLWEVWPALCSGASVLLVDEEVRTSPTLLRRWLLDNGVTIAFVPTVLAETMIASEWPATSELRFLLTGGETLHRRPRPGLPFAVVNNYGPSECTVVATSGLIESAAEGAPDIGRAITGAQIYLLNDAGDPVADGEAGEIIIGGAGVGRGYRNRPDLTGERFFRDRFNAAQAGRLYRTGDFGRRLPDGRIMFLGRNDAQEQVRGSRVEPAEVAAALSRHTAVGWCAVVGDGPIMDRQLVAYVLPAPGAQPSSENLRAFLGTLLPAAMIPSVFVRIEAVPLTANGKFDRAGLPPLAMAMLLAQAGFRYPETPAQARLSTIISGLLGGIPVGVDDNFFLLGGHSLLGTQVVLRAQEAFGVRLSLRDLFQAPTVAGLADRVADLLAAQLDEMTDAEAELWAAD